MLATVVLLLVHVPPVVASVKVVVVPSQMVTGTGLIGSGPGETVTVFITLHEPII
jgi:hypothetical protein